MFLRFPPHRFAVCREADVEGEGNSAPFREFEGGALNVSHSFSSFCGAATRSRQFSFAQT